jgi:protoheme IX farnesyltransferase
VRPLELKFRPFTELARTRISFFAALSASACFVLASSTLTMRCALVSAGVFLLASGSGALNHYQESDTDRLMPRTAGRPIPSGRIRPQQALLFSISLICSGSALLLAYGGVKPALLGLFAVLWYNGVYVYLKKKSAFSVIPGALTGAVPPAIGWISGGGMSYSPVLVALCMCFFIWQVPHSWLLFLEYGSEYEKAGLPSLTRIWSRRQIIRNTFVWTLCTAIICLIVSLYTGPVAPVIRIALIAAAFWLAVSGAMLFNDKRNREARAFLFGKLNAYIFVSMALMVCDRLFDLS